MTAISTNATFFFRDIKLSHSIFALPFAACGLFFVEASLPNLNDLVLFLVCMVSARSFAMGANRFLDRHIDAANPRTANREIPSGRLPSAASLGWTLFSGGFFVGAAFMVREEVGYLSLPLLVVLASYSLMKRWTWISHWYLGLCLGLAPVGASIAFGGGVNSSLVLLAFAITFWTAGFDILYATQDVVFDQKSGLASVPARFGLARAVWLSRVSFACMLLLLILVGLMRSVGIVYWISCMIIAGLLVWEHWLVRDIVKHGHSHQIQKAFFTANCYISIIYYLGVQLDYLLLTWVR